MFAYMKQELCVGSGLPFSSAVIGSSFMLPCEYFLNVTSFSFASEVGKTL